MSKMDSRKRIDDYKLIATKGEWKAVAIECDDGFNNFDDFDGLVAIEELTDYQLNDTQTHNYHDNQSQTDIISKNNAKKRKKKIVKHANEEKEVFEVNEISDKPENDNDLDKNERKYNKIWGKLLVPQSIIKALKDLKFVRPTSVQSMAIITAIRDRLNIICAAETGSGKTLAFAIPIIHFIINDKLDDCSQHLRALVLTPTRELAIQVKRHIEAVAKYTGVSVAVLVGGMSIEKQERVLRKHAPDIVVATPGRLWQLIEDDSVQHLNLTAVSNVKYLVIDEADRMTERGHFDELRRLFQTIMTNQIERQFFVCSATLTLNHKLPKRFKFLKQNKQNEANKMNTIIEMLSLRDERTKVIDLTREGVGTPSEQMLTETKINCFSQEKDLYLYYFISLNPGRTIVFCNSKDCVRRLLNVLRLLQLSPLALHASMPQKRRLANLEKFTNNCNSVLIASDVAARGLDVANIDHVVHYQIPRTAEIYVHRSGRTARAFNKGLSLMLCEPKEDSLYYKNLCRTLNKGNDLSLFPIDQKILKKIKLRIDLARKLDQMEHKLRKNKSNNDWFRKAAKQCEIFIEEDDESDSHNNLDSNRDALQFKIMTKQLKSLLKQPLSLVKPF